jgi:DNA gyrase subunit A
MSIFDLSLEQANYILEMPLRRLTRFSRIELEAERDQLHATIESLEELLRSEDVLRNTLDQELADVADSFGTPRRTVLLDSAGPTVSPEALEIPDEQCQVLVSATGMAARTPASVTVTGGAKRMPHDALRTVISATTRSQVAVITSDARVLPLDVVDLPSLPDTADSPSLKATVAIRDYLHLPADATVAGVVGAGATIALVTGHGRVKRLVVEPGVKQVMALEHKDTLVAAFACEPTQDVVLISSNGQLLRTGVDTIPVQGAGARGVAGMRLKDGARVIAAGTGGVGATVVTIAGSGSAASSVKVTPLQAFPRTGRDGVGVRCHRLLAAESALIGGWIGDDLLASSPGGKPLPLPEPDERRDASGSTSPAAKIVIGSAAPSRGATGTGLLFE